MAHDKIDKKVMKGTIFMEVPDPQAKEVWSEKQQIGGFEWQAHMKRDAHRDRFVIICNSGCVDSLWLCRAKYTFEVREEDGEWTEWEEMGPNYFFNANNSVFETLLDANNERLKPNAVKAHIQVVWAPHESCFPDFDAILNVKYGKKSALFHVNRYILAYHSPTYFRNFFFGDWSERRTSQPKPLPKVGHNNELEIQDIEEKADLNLKAFGSMLYFVHHSALIVNQQDFLERFHGLLDIVELAVKYTFPMLVHHVEQCLIKGGSGTMEQLVVAEAQNLPALKKHCLETLDLIEYGKNITENIALREKLGKATRQLLDKRIKETAERYSRKRKIFELEDDRYSNATDADDDSDYQALI